MYEFEAERRSLADLSADLPGTALDALRVALKEHAAVLQQFMGDPKRPTLDRWSSLADNTVSAFKGASRELRKT